MHDDSRKLKAEEHEHPAVQGELQRSEHSHCLAPRATLADVEDAEPRKHHACGCGRKDARDMEMLAEEVRPVRERGDEEDPSFRCVVAGPEDQPLESSEQPRDDASDRDAACGHDHQLACGLPPYEAGGRGRRRRDRHAKADEPGGVVEESLALEHVHEARRHAHAPGDPRDSDGIGWREGARDRKRDGERNRWDARSDQKAETDDREHDEPEGQQEDRSPEPPEVALRDPPAIDEEERRDEDEQEDLRLQL
ncbi:MAG: hypothetical protein K0S65_3790, partial [Labilithrix sp.]|nr:hypothetical protein [Labilithrix sp.]